ncbi:MAG: hypothetical protein HOC91_07035 [Nitrospinaceae bacterium]|jgi:hypothetical protein|nr:hypothetical protein [Nitrospinaceae bacterium]MBT3434224.1 hypothetical protein [Nitrospinaceae bacterium]MBT3820639.1 hypothetical protein [Nitrospinaceae bacterium]MBT4095520.1 hypothetical protein [Nitrospinaceae bacterium]MBT4430251.1 hypothetical protein [Nitrospinaceae bacterium]
MGYVVAAYVVVLGSMLLYWWSLYSRADRLKAEVLRNAESPDDATEIREE